MPSALPPEPPQRLARSLAALSGDTAEGAAGAQQRWLAGLHPRWERALERWELTPERVVSPGGRSSLVTLVRQADGTQAALKLLAPYGAGAQERAEREREALERWDGWGAVRLLGGHSDDGALLLERLHGETSLRSLPEAKAMLEAASAARRLWGAAGRPGGELSIPSVAAHTADETAALGPCAPSEARPLWDQALALRASLVEAPPEETLLHGDFRQGAVLAADADRAPWLAAGPDPLVGECAYDLARLVRDRLHDLFASPGAASITRRRLHSLADSLDIDRERLRGWTFYRAVVSGVRHLRDGNREDGELLLEFASWL